MENGIETEIILIRHGETLWNIEGRWQGHDDSPLTETGIKQAEAVARRLSGLPFSALYSSDLGRAVKTAGIIANTTGHEIICEKRLRERNVGIFQGLTLMEMKERFPEAFKKYHENDPDFVIPQGESMKHRLAVNVDCLNEIAENNLGKRVVVVTHGGVLNGMFKYVLRIPPEANRRYKIRNTALNSFIYGENGWILQTWGDISHFHPNGLLDEVDIHAGN